MAPAPTSPTSAAATPAIIDAPMDHNAPIPQVPNPASSGPDLASASPAAAMGRGDVLIGGAVLSSKIDDADHTIALLKPQFVVCYNKGLQIDPTMVGRLTITAVLKSDGTVDRAVVNSNKGVHKDVAACITDVLARGQFTKVGSGSPSIMIPMTLSSK